MKDAVVALDSGVLILAAKGDADARAFLVRFRQADAMLIIPAPVLAEVLRDSKRDAALHRLIGDVEKIAPTDASSALRGSQRHVR